MKPLVSIIVPVYNTVLYLEECVESLQNQTYQNIQILLVDDGSKDESPELCDKLASRYENVSVIHKVNQGLGMARNSGLEKVTGKYVGFLDSDDTLDIDTIEGCVAVLEDNNADACFYGRKTQGKDGIYKVNDDIPTRLQYDRQAIRQEFVKNYFGRLPKEQSSDYIQASACCAMYRKAIIDNNHIKFVSEREYLSEDTFFNLEFCKFSNTIMIIPKCYYNYRYNAKSLTKSYNPKRITQLKSYMKLLREYIDDYPELDDISQRVNFMFYIYIRPLIEIEIAIGRQSGIKQTIKRVREVLSDDEIIYNARLIPLNILNFKRKTFVRCMLRKHILFMILYYR